MTDAVTINRFVRWWPPVGVLAMLVLGLLVGKNSTPMMVTISVVWPLGYANAGMFVLITGGRLWAVPTAVTASLLGMLGLACTYHFLTDTIGAAMVATAMVCVAARAARAPVAPLQV
jgi:hypothetical protein